MARAGRERAVQHLREGKAARPRRRPTVWATRANQRLLRPRVVGAARRPRRPTVWATRANQRLLRPRVVGAARRPRRPTVWATRRRQPQPHVRLFSQIRLSRLLAQSRPQAQCLPLFHPHPAPPAHPHRPAPRAPQAVCRVADHRRPLRPVLGPVSTRQRPQAKHRSAPCRKIRCRRSPRAFPIRPGRRCTRLHPVARRRRWLHHLRSRPATQ
ncbi:hypothetical protein BN975_03201 [Mycolicibacterium farcinogenes]|uniref:Uncharacterized protein n=1 Tax=Mycolicibacterium senegalense TaxID=1796 RepID=A0A378W782_9MYCO|nr:hypothetical protein BN975_03201 [Mycolicibacterium farcinogenes]SUA28836.1 Uncharacterised protein [Mycolicibacterium senegalense]